MGRRPCCSKEGLNRGAWTALEDKMLTTYVKTHGEGGWRNLPQKAGLERCGKSCRLRWMNYLRPDIKRGNISHDEEELIAKLHKLLGNRWSLIAGRVPGRTDNEIKNYWNTKLRRTNNSQSSSKSSKKGPIGKSKSRNQYVQPKNTSLPTRARAVAIPNQTQPIRTKAYRCTKVIIQTLPFPNSCHSISDINSTTLNSQVNKTHECPQDSCSSKMGIGAEGIDGTTNGFYESDDLQIAGTNSIEMNYNFSNNDSNHSLEFEDLLLQDWTMISNALHEENGHMDLGSLPFILDDDEKW